MLFPAWAGVIPDGGQYMQDNAPFPRMGGGDPSKIHDAMMEVCFSPHGRG